MLHQNDLKQAVLACQVHKRSENNSHEILEQVWFVFVSAGLVERLEYDPGRTGYLALVRYQATAAAQPSYKYILAPQVSGGATGGLLLLWGRKGGREMMIIERTEIPRLVPYACLRPTVPCCVSAAPQALKPGDAVASGADAAIRTGNCLPLRDIPVGMDIFNIELVPGKGGQLCRSAGCSAQVLSPPCTRDRVNIVHCAIVDLRCAACWC